MSLLCFIGPPGAGKSTIGRLVALALDLPFTDTDLLVEQSAGCSVSDIFLEHGEPHFRELERSVCAELLTRDQGVVSLGGGAILDPGTQALLRKHTVVFLDVAIADAAHRVGFAQSRPLLALNPRAKWSELMAIRRPIYESLATVTVDTAGHSAADSTNLVLNALVAWEPA